MHDVTAIHITAEINARLDEIEKNREQINSSTQRIEQLESEIRDFTRALYKESEVFKNEQKRGYPRSREH